MTNKNSRYKIDRKNHVRLNKTEVFDLIITIIFLPSFHFMWGRNNMFFFSILCQPSSQYSLQYVLRLISSIVELVRIFFSIVRPSNLFLINWLGRLIAYTCYFQFSHSPSIMFWPSCSYRPHSFLTFFLLPDSHLSVWRTPSKPPQNIYSYISSVTFSVVRCYFH